MKLLASILVAPAVAIVLFSVACGGDDNNGGSSNAPTVAPTVEPPAAPVALNVTTMDNSFSPTTLTAKAGQKVTVNIKNDGQRPHTFTIDGVVDSGRLNGGESKTVEFTPTQSGALTFYCTVHTAAVMSGTINVSASGG
ncbi:MAG TPA: cupredoxin domain-containing protein [Dehalococcoidia bacterium]|jgi:plastocyanin|nr:cupredoxin domain-containing protein [Dehalococcoidia bacterium]